MHYNIFCRTNFGYYVIKNEEEKKGGLNDVDNFLKLSFS